MQLPGLLDGNSLAKLQQIRSCNHNYCITIVGNNFNTMQPLWLPPPPAGEGSLPGMLPHTTHKMPLDLHEVPGPTDDMMQVGTCGPGWVGGWVVGGPWLL